MKMVDPYEAGYSEHGYRVIPAQLPQRSGQNRLRLALGLVFLALLALASALY